MTIRQIQTITEDRSDSGARDAAPPRIFTCRLNSMLASCLGKLRKTLMPTPGGISQSVIHEYTITSHIHYSKSGRA
jgi:hypothetical protein